MKSNDILVIHFRSPMDYPPVYNLTRYLASTGTSVMLVAGKWKESCVSLKEYGVNVIEIPMLKSSGLGTYVAYFSFYWNAFKALIKNPKVPVLYFESISAPPVFLFFLLLPFSGRILAIHYHEYFDKAEHKKQSFLERFGRALEPLLFRKAKWISHTNKDRLQRFHGEFPKIANEKLRLMPNFPPATWLHQRDSSHDGDTLKLVYVGALSRDGLYLKELVEWMCTQQGKITCDIYSKSTSDEMLEYFKRQPYNVITYKGSLRYDDIPAVLRHYNVGLILYKGIGSSNVMFSASNKLFEYLACGLDVWFSKPLISSYEYETTNTYPKVIKIDFSNLKEFDYSAALRRDGLQYKSSNFVMESVYKNFFDSIMR